MVGVVERIAPSELKRALSVVLAGPQAQRRASAQQVRGFLTYLQQSAAEWEGWRDGPAAAPTALLLALRLPGRTALLMPAAPGALGIDYEAQRALTAAGLTALQPEGLHYAQVLLEPEAAPKAALLTEVGFRRLAPLVYLERDAVYPWVDPPAAESAEWIPYSAARHGDFARVVLGTYEESHDCPELAGLRPIEDVLAAHRAAGRFEPRLWELARVDRQLAGVLLAAELTGRSMLEIVYMGVLPGARGRGVGGLLLRRALEQSRAAGVRQLAAVVDDRNAPAKHLYARFGLAPVARRDAWLYRWSTR
ncbi:MAG: GNAT family N-acetyltransferase [Planctomycetota bacterium]